MGKVLVKQQNVNKWLLKEVRHVPNLKKNLISTGQLGGEGCVTTFTYKAWKVTRGALVIAKGEKGAYELVDFEGNKLAESKNGLYLKRFFS